MEEEQQDITHALQIGRWRAALMFTTWGLSVSYGSAWLCCQRTLLLGYPRVQRGISRIVPAL